MKDHQHLMDRGGSYPLLSFVSIVFSISAFMHDLRNIGVLKKIAPWYKMCTNYDSI